MRQLSLVVGVLAVVAVAVAAVACMFSPLLSNPGPEAAGVLSIVGGIALGLAQAVRAAQKSERGAWDDALGGLALAAVCTAVFVVATAIGGRVHPTCQADRGYVSFFLLAAPVMVFQVALGTLVGRFVRRPRRALLVMLAVELLMAAWLLFDWVQNPGFVVHSHAFVVVEGDLLHGASLSNRAVTFRFATACFGAALLCFAAAVYPRIRRAGLNTQAISRPAVYGMAIALAVCGWFAHRAALKQFPPSHDTLVADYSLVKQRGPLIVHADPHDTRPRDVDAMLAEGTLWLERLRTRLGVQAQQDVHIFVHATPDKRAHYTGAQHVDFALPWRREIHLSSVEVPHDSLGHELAHVLAGELSNSLLKTPGSMLLFNNAAVTEGVAVAVTPELSVRDGLTTREQAAAMHAMAKTPNTIALFEGVSFFTENPSRAYVAAGAVIESLFAHALPDPTAALRTLYATGSLKDAAGGAELLPAFAAEHDEMLRTLPLPADAAVAARARFSAPSILDTTCDPEQNILADEVRVMSRSGNVAGAIAQASTQGPLSVATLQDLYVDAADNRDNVALLDIAARLASATEGDTSANAEAYGDALWRTGRGREALATWARTPIETRAYESQRTLWAKRLLADCALRAGDATSVAKSALNVLVKAELRQSAFLALAAAVATPSYEPPAVVALGRYILARRLVQLGAVAQGATLLTQVLQDSALPEPFVQQAQLTLGTALLRKGDAQQAATLLFDAADRAKRPAMRLVLKDRAERAQRAVNAPPAPELATATSDTRWADRLLLGQNDAGDVQ